MGFTDQAAKTSKYNQNLLRKKRFFSKIGESKAIRKSSKIDSLRFKRKSNILIKRYRKGRILRFLIVYPVILASLIAMLVKLFF